MTVTDEIDIYRVMKRAGRKRADMAKAVAPLVQAAYAAGLERAAVIAENYGGKTAYVLATAIRAEKDKP